MFSIQFIKWYDFFLKGTNVYSTSHAEIKTMSFDIAQTKVLYHSRPQNIVNPRPNPQILTGEISEQIESRRSKSKFWMIAYRKLKFK